MAVPLHLLHIRDHVHFHDERHVLSGEYRGNGGGFGLVPVLLPLQLHRAQLRHHVIDREDVDLFVSQFRNVLRVPVDFEPRSESGGSPVEQYFHTGHSG